MDRADVVVVGAGGAGAVLAARLSEDSARRVVLVEAGPVPAVFDRRLVDARLVPGARPDTPEVRRHPVRLTPGRDWSVPRGRVLGGSTTVNGGYFVRARRQDFADWAAAGGEHWAYPQVLPLLRALETDLDFGPSELHGGDGPVPVHRAPLDHPAARALGAAALALGYPPDPDKNDQAAPGFGPVPSNAVAGVRHNTAMAYLTPGVLARPNLTVHGGRPVGRVLVGGGRATRATGVLLADGTELRAGEVVLSAGALATPVLLLASGIGPPADLDRAGVPVTVPAPAVGATLSDHPQLVLDQAVEGPLAPPEQTWLGGCLHTPGDVEILQSLVPMRGLVDGAVSMPGGRPALLVSPLRPRDGGRITLASIDFGYLATAADRAELRAAVRLATALGGIGPDPATLAGDGPLDHWIAARLGTANHTCGTVPMGPAADGYGRVHGVRGLRVADTSLLPAAPRRGPAATAVLIGELVADAIRTDR